MPRAEKVREPNIHRFAEQLLILVLWEAGAQPQRKRGLTAKVKAKHAKFLNPCPFVVKNGFECL